MAQKFLAIAVISLFFACSEPDDNSTPNPIDNNPPTEFLGRWISGNPLPTPRQEMPHAVLNGKIYVPGGLDRSGNGSTVMEVYDPGSDTWSTAASIPERLHHLGLASTNGKIYILGGYQGTHLHRQDEFMNTMPIKTVGRQKPLCLRLAARMWQ